MCVALRATKGQTKPGGSGGIDPIGHRMKAKLERINAALFVNHRIAQKTRRHALLLRRVRQQIPGHLLDDELVVAHVLVQRVNHPVAPEPNIPRLVFLIPIRIGIPRRVQPVPRPALAIVRRRQQPVHLDRKSTRLNSSHT